MKSKNIIIGCIAVAFVISLSAVSYGQTDRNEHPKKRPTFKHLLEKMDENKDGKLAKGEVKGPLKERFTEFDKDKDGFISEEEFLNAPKRKGKKKKQMR